MKIVHLIPVDGIGGAENAARSMATADSLSCSFSLMVIAGGTLAKKRQRIIESPFKSENNILAYFRITLAILQKKPDILICSLWRSMLVGIVIKLLRPNIKIVCFLHSACVVHKGDLIISNIMLKVCDQIWADSLTTLTSRIDSFQKKPSRVISFVTTHLSKTRSINPCKANFIFWGRLHKHKGIDRAIDFLSELISRGIDVNFEIWGPDCGELENLTNLVVKKGLSTHISFMGPAETSDFLDIATRNTFFLQLSHLEGMAMSVAEAMQYGLVPVVTPVGEISRYCQAGINAVIVDDVEKSDCAITEILKLLQDESRYRQYQQAAQSYWDGSILYKNDVCDAAAELFNQNHK